MQQLCRGRCFRRAPLNHRFLSRGVVPPSYVCCFQAARHGYTASGPIHFCQQHRQVMCRASARAGHALIYTPGGALRSRKSVFFRCAGPNMTGVCWAAAKRDAHGHLRAFPAPQLAGSPVQPGRAARAAGGCLVRRAVASGPTTPRGQSSRGKIKTITPPRTDTPRAAPSHCKGPSTPSPRRRGRRSPFRLTVPARRRQTARALRKRPPETPPRS